MKMPQLWRRPRSVLKIFLIFLLGLNVIFEKKRKKGHHADGGIFFSDFMVISTKKKKGPSSEFCKFSTRFVRHARVRRHVPQLSTVFSGKQKRRFLEEEKKHRNLQKFSAKMLEKISHFFALIGNIALGPINARVLLTFSVLCLIWL